MTRSPAPDPHDITKFASPEVLRVMALMQDLGQFGPLYTVARRLKSAEAEGRPESELLKEYSMAVHEQYCSTECQLTDWNTPSPYGYPKHKTYCKDSINHMKRLPQLQSIIRLFPWGRVELDGSTSHDLALARYAVLGCTLDFGYWARPGGVASHDLGRASNPLVSGDKDYPGHGAILLRQLPNERVAWKLEGNKMIPRLFFDDEVLAPSVPRDSVVDWESWYKWRKISLQSPVALLMDYPMSVYQLLVHVLGVVPVENLRAFPAERQKLLVHYLGAELELNFIPIFAELALLIPNTDITVIFFGAAVQALVRRARATAPRCPAALPSPFTYRAPASLGGSTYTAKLFSDSDEWPVNFEGSGLERPDAVVALNAGLASYPSWSNPITHLGIQGIPFGVTEYAEQSLERAVELVKKLSDFGRGKLRAAGLDTRGLDKSVLGPIELNPFMRPGQRALSMMNAPNAYNGLTMRRDEYADWEAEALDGEGLDDTFTLEDIAQIVAGRYKPCSPKMSSWSDGFNTTPDMLGDRKPMYLMLLDVGSAWMTMDAVSPVLDRFWKFGEVPVRDE